MIAVPPVGAPGRPRLRRALRMLALLALLVGVALFGWHRWSSGWRPDAAQWPVQGLALGPQNEPVSWPGIAQGPARFAYISATDGARIANPNFTRDHDAASLHNIRTGAIHHYAMCASAGDQAAAFVRLVPRESAALPTLVMLEPDPDCARQPTRALLLAELSTFLGQIETHMGKAAVIAPDAAMEAQYDLARAINRPLMLRAVRSEPAAESSGWALWLANDRLRLPGASGSVDWLVLNDRGNGP